MSEIKDLFVPYEIALQLKEKGFDEPCFGIFLNEYSNNPGYLYSREERNICNEEIDEEGNIIGVFVTYSNSKIFEQYTTAPLYQQVIDWFREIHKLDISHTVGFPLSYSFHVQDLDREQKYWNFNGPEQVHKHYYEGLNKAIEEALKLIS